MWGPMTINAWPNLRIGTGKVAKNLKILWGKVGEFIWGPRFWFPFFVTHVTQQVTKRKYKSSCAFPDATDAFSDASIVYYSNEKIFVPLTLLKNCLTFYLAKYTVDISAL